MDTFYTDIIAFLYIKTEWKRIRKPHEQLLKQTHSALDTFLIKKKIKELPDLTLGIFT